MDIKRKTLEQILTALRASKTTQSKDALAILETAMLKKYCYLLRIWYQNETDEQVTIFLSGSAMPGNKYRDEITGKEARGEIGCPTNRSNIEIYDKNDGDIEVHITIDYLNCTEEFMYTNGHSNIPISLRRLLSEVFALTGYQIPDLTGWVQE